MSKNLINYNFMTLPAKFCLDMSDVFYKNAGVGRVNKNGFELIKLKDFDVIFVKTDFIYSGEFQRRFLNSINKKFILISGVSSYSIDEGDPTYQDILKNPYLMKWFCTNPPLIPHHKLEGLPIGFEEREREGGNIETLNYFYENNNLWDSKYNKIYIPYHSNTFSSRNKIIEELSTKEFVDMEPNRLNFKDYLNKMSKYKFVLSLRGAGWDCHRHYEALLVGSVPIMDGGPILELFKKNSLPVLDISEIDYQIFNKSFDFLYSRDFLTMDHHFNKINSIKK
tara:strand:- start:1317 stop:2159 length:843 start_codon:yes stop_codon:yes gene_type:complete